MWLSSEAAEFFRAVLYNQQQQQDQQQVGRWGAGAGRRGRCVSERACGERRGGATSRGLAFKRNATAVHE